MRTSTPIPACRSASTFFVGDNTTPPVIRRGVRTAADLPPRTASLTMCFSTPSPARIRFHLPHPGGKSPCRRSRSTPRPARMPCRRSTMRPNGLGDTTGTFTLTVAAVVPEAGTLALFGFALVPVGSGWRVPTPGRCAGSSLARRGNNAIPFFGGGTHGGGWRPSNISSHRIARIRDTVPVQ